MPEQAHMDGLLHVALLVTAVVCVQTAGQCSCEPADVLGSVPAQVLDHSHYSTGTPAVNCGLALVQACESEAA